MVIRRIREHVATHDWFAVAIDFLIVVAGIVIGTQVNNWNQSRIERNQGKEYRERLIADLRANEADMLKRRTYYRSVREHAERALAALDRPTVNDGAAFLLDAFVASHSAIRQPKRFTYDELISTGRIGQIGDAKLRENVSDYYVRLDGRVTSLNFIPPYRDQIRALMPNAVQEAIRSQCGPYIDAIVTAPPPRGAVVQTGKCTIALNPAAVARAVAVVRSSPEVSAGLTRLIADLHVKQNLVESIMAHARQLRARIEKKI